MALKTDALQKGLNNFVAVDTHVAKGSKLAKGQDSVAGEMAQFSSLMNVMQDDFALMGAMQREYQSEKSSVEPTLPDISDDVVEKIEQSDLVGNDEQVVILDGEFLEALPEVQTVELPLVEFQNLQVVDEGLDVVQQELIAPVLSSLMDDVVEDSVETALPLVPVVIDNVQNFNVQQNSVDVSVAPTKIVNVPTLQDVPQVLIQEVTDVFRMLTSESVDSPDENVPVLSERLDLPSFLREGIRLLDDVVAEVVLDNDLESLEMESRAIQSQGVDLVRESWLPSTPIEPSLDVMNNPILQASGAASIASTGPTSSVGGAIQADGVSIQQSKEFTDLKKPKLPNMMLTRQHFDDQVEEGQESGNEQMTFASKLLQRLELVVMDPLGRMDVEVAQEMVGVQVKTIVPSEMVQTLQGIEQELQVALNNQGLELSSFEMQERDAAVEKQGSNTESRQVTEDQFEENEEKSLLGGMLVSRRV